MKQPHTIYLFLLLAIAAISAEGCTLVGYGIGSLIETGYSHDTTQAFTKPLFRDVNDNTGRFARIQYNDSTVRFATFNGYTDEPDSAYRTRWDSFTDKYPITSKMLPFKIGDSVELNKDSWLNKKAGMFEAYLPEGIYLRIPPHTQHLSLL